MGLMGKQRIRQYCVNKLRMIRVPLAVGTFRNMLCNLNGSMKTMYKRASYIRSAHFDLISIYLSYSRKAALQSQAVMKVSRVLTEPHNLYTLAGVNITDERRVSARMPLAIAEQNGPRLCCVYVCMSVRMCTCERVRVRIGVCVFPLRTPQAETPILCCVVV